MAQKRSTREQSAANPGAADAGEAGSRDIPEVCRRMAFTERARRR